MADSASLVTLFENCPLCSNTATCIGRYDGTMHPLFDSRLPAIMEWMRCDCCTHIYRSEYFNEAGLEILFSRANTHQILSPTVLEPIRPLLGRSIDRIIPLLKSSPRTWLDVGFGNGALMAVAMEYGFTAFGIDLRQEAVQAARTYKLNAFTADLLTFTPEQTFQVISFMDVLEHIPLPRPSIKKAAELLENNGLLIISCPGTDSILWNMLSKENANPYWAEIEHVHNFSANRLDSFMAEEGFLRVGFGISERYRMGMELIYRKITATIQ